MVSDLFSEQRMKGARFSPENSRQIVRRIVVEGEFVLETPAHFGGGESDGTEVLLLEDAVEHKPLLPGASLAGALRHTLLRRERGYRAQDDSTTLAAQLFGTAYNLDEGEQSRVIVDDAVGDGQLESRDGVKINGVYRTAEEGALYTFRVWAKGTQFPLRFELCLYEQDADGTDQYISAFATALHALSEGHIPLGARKNRGYGRGRVASWRVLDCDLTTPTGFMAWLKHGGQLLESKSHNTIFKALNTTALDIDERRYVSLDASFTLLDSLLIRAEDDVADMAHLKSGGQPVLSGTSLTGALRARALKIANTLALHDAQNLIDDLFGMHGSSENGRSSKDRSASRMIVEEHPLIDPVVDDLVQNRVRIDRFTGGAFETGLFSQQPVFASDETGVRVKLELQYPADHKRDDRHHAQVGLLLLVLKDLWLEDLPLGGESSVGRGRLRGRTAMLHFHHAFNEEDSTIEISQSPSALSPNERASLEWFVSQLNSTRGEPA